MNIKRKTNMISEQHKDELIRKIRYIGDSLIRNAESIVGNENIFNINISVNGLNEYNVPTIHIEKEFLPEQYLDGNGE